MNGTLENATNSSIPFMSSVDDTEVALRTAVNSIYLILVLPINSYVVWLILSGAGGTMTSECFYLNLTASLIIFSLTAVPYFAWLFTGISIFYVVCDIGFFIFFFSVPSFHCCICVERYMAVVRPVVFLRYRALQHRVVCCCVVWLTVIAFSLLDIWFRSVLSYILLGFATVCIFGVSFLCYSVLRALKQPVPGEGQRDGGGEGNNMKRRAFRIILISLIVMVVTTLSYMPFVLSHLLDRPVAYYITYTIAMMSVFVHPLLYIYKAGKLPCIKGL